MLVVADERPVRVGGERRLAGAGQTEEERDVVAVGAELALQCMGKIPLPGSTWFMTVKIDFLISPA